MDGRSMLVCRPVKAVVSRMSSALLATSISLYLGSAMLSRGGDEFGAHIGEIAAEHLRRAQRVAVADAARQHDRPVEERAHRADEHERVEPAGLAAGARGQQHQSVGAGRYRALGVADAGDVGEHQRARVMQRRQHRRRRADAE